MRCWRCGVDWDFDADAYKPDAPCPDCQEDVPGEWVWTNKHRKRIDEKQLRAFCAQNMSDPEIAREIGFTVRSVQRARTRLKIPPTTIPAWEFIKDKEAARAQARGAWLSSTKPRKVQNTKRAGFLESTQEGGWNAPSRRFVLD